MEKKWTKIGMAMVVMITSVSYPMTQEATEKSETQLNTESAKLFIDSIGPKARVLAAENDLYASIMIAQAVLESGYGRSTLSQSPNNNLYGVKAGPNYNGPSVAKETSEYDKNKNLYYIVDKFKVYSSPEESMKDYVTIFTKTAWYKQYYAGVFRSVTTDYKQATAALTGTYATDINYEKKLNEIIEQYNLTQYDVPENQIVYEYNEGVYLVKKGDTLSSISTKVNESVDDIKFWNGIAEGVSIAEGQELIIVKKTIKYIGERPIEPAPTITSQNKQEANNNEKIEQSVSVNLEEKVVNNEEIIVAQENQQQTIQEQQINQEQKNNQEQQNNQEQESVKEQENNQEEIVFVEKENTVEEEKAYTVKSGDTLYYIAKKINMTVEELKEENNLVDNKVNEGQVLKTNKKIENLNQKINTEEKQVRKEIIKTNDKTKIKEKPKKTSSTIAGIEKNQIVEIIEQKDGWVKVNYAMYQGWIKESQITKEIVIEKITYGSNNNILQHIVKEGESIYQIAEKYAKTVKELKEKNNFSDDIKLKSGEKVIIE